MLGAAASHHSPPGRAKYSEPRFRQLHLRQKCRVDHRETTGNGAGGEGSAATIRRTTAAHVPMRAFDFIPVHISENRDKAASESEGHIQVVHSLPRSQFACHTIDWVCRRHLRNLRIGGEFPVVWRVSSFPPEGPKVPEPPPLNCSPEAAIDYFYAVIEMVLGFHTRKQLLKLRADNAADPDFVEMIDYHLANRFWKTGEHPDEDVPDGLSPG